MKHLYMRVNIIDTMKCIQSMTVIHLEMISMILVESKKINDVEFDVEIALNQKVCILRWNGNPFFFEDVDLAQVIRAVKNSSDVAEVADGLKGIWREDKILPILKSFALDEIDADDFCDALCNEKVSKRMSFCSRVLRNSEPETDIWYRHRAMMYDAIMEVLE